MGINTLSITDAEALLEIIPPEDNAFGQIRWLFGLYIDGTEGINEKFVLDSDVFKGFFAVFSEQVYQVLIGNATRIKEKKEITMLHDGHLLEMRIQKLKKNLFSRESSNTVP